jgi:hypothetical protein
VAAPSRDTTGRPEWTSDDRSATGSARVELERTIGAAFASPTGEEQAERIAHARRRELPELTEPDSVAEVGSPMGPPRPLVTASGQAPRPGPVNLRRRAGCGRPDGGGRCG